MTQDALEIMLFQIMNAEIKTYPFPHFVAASVFTPAFYEQLQANLPPLAACIGIKESGLVQGHKDDVETRYLFRFFEDMDKLPEAQRPFWESLKNFILSERFANAIIQKFLPFITQRFQQKGKQESISMRLDLLRDFTGYELGPHTDTARRLLNLFFYLPADTTHPEFGTSLYVPKDPAFSCQGGPHYSFDKFIRVFTAPYTPGTAVGFFRTNQSFHGVEPVALQGFERNALALSMYAD